MRKIVLNRKVFNGNCHFSAIFAFIKLELPPVFSRPILINSTITLLLDDGKIKEKYEAEFNYAYDEYTDKISGITIVKVSKSTYKYPVDFNETDLYNFQKTIDQFKV